MKGFQHGAEDEVLSVDSSFPLTESELLCFPYGFCSDLASASLLLSTILGCIPQSVSITNPVSLVRPRLYSMSAVCYFLITLQEPVLPISLLLEEDPFCLVTVTHLQLRSSYQRYVLLYITHLYVETFSTFFWPRIQRNHVR